MAEPTEREHELARALDARQQELEQLGLTLDEHTERNCAELAHALAEHREEVLRGLEQKTPAAEPAGNEGG